MASPSVRSTRRQPSGTWPSSGTTRAAGTRASTCSSTQSFAPTRPRSRSGSTANDTALFHGEDVDGTNVGVGGQEFRADDGETLRDLAVDVCLAGFDGFEGVEDPVGRVADLERVPGHGSLLLNRELAAGHEERCEVRFLAGLCFEEGEQSESHAHLVSPFWFGRVRAWRRRFERAASRAMRSWRGSRRIWVSRRPPWMLAIVALASSAGSASARSLPRAFIRIRPSRTWDFPRSIPAAIPPL